MFHGEHDRKLDYKGRLGIPEELLSAMGDEWRRAIVLKRSSDLGGENGNGATFLSLYDVDTWNAFLETAHSRLDPDEGRVFMHTVVGESATVDVDASKRITLPDRFLQYAGIERQQSVRVVGVFDHVEVWNPDTYMGYLNAATSEGISVLSIEELARSRIQEVS